MQDHELRQLIEARIAARCDDRLASTATGTVELDQTRTGRLSRIDALQGQAMAQATEARRQAECQRLKAALARIEHGTGGECIECGEVIADARLHFDPSATLCLACAERAEE